MSRKVLWSTLGCLAVGAIAAGAVVLLKSNNKDTKEDSDDGIHFITIEDGDVENKEEPKTYSAEGKSDEVKEICAVYPYLDPDFVEELLNKNSSFETSFEEDILVTIQHHVKFEDSQERKAFMEIMEVGGYETSSKDEEVVAQRRFFYQNGAIISDILNVANQTKALQGEYLDYDVR